LLEYREFSVYWEGHATVRVKDNGFSVAVDPFKDVENDFTADIIMVTHKDIGHFDPDTIEKVTSPNSCVVVPDSIDSSEVPCDDTEVIAEGETIDVYGVEIEATAMYNDEHERGEGIGYRFVMANTAFYVAGDTGITEQMFDLESRVDLAFLPIDGEYTMDIEDAVKSAVRIKPDMVIPYHYGRPFFEARDVDLRGLKTALEDRNIKCNIQESYGE